MMFFLKKTSSCEYLKGEGQLIIQIFKRVETCWEKKAGYTKGRQSVFLVSAHFHLHSLINLILF